jgi:ribosomal protein S18 acetylase RimI-like enzyme
MKEREIFSFRNQIFRRARESDVPNIRLLVNSSYKELADMGLNYTATYQDEQITLERISKGRAFLLEKEGTLLGTVLLKRENWFTGKNSAYVSQLAVAPTMKRQRLGSLLMDLCEDLAIKEGFESIQLDTAKPAQHLVSWYKKRGYKIVGETHWEGKTYESWIFEKSLI